MLFIEEKKLFEETFIEELICHGQNVILKMRQVQWSTINQQSHDTDKKNLLNNQEPL